MKTLYSYLIEQRRFATATFGPYDRPRLNGILDHVRKETQEIAAEPTDLEEWIDLLILAMDGALCAATAPLVDGEWTERQSVQTVDLMLQVKMDINKARSWPTRDQQVAGKAVEHIRAVEA